MSKCNTQNSRSQEENKEKAEAKAFTKQFLNDNQQYLHTKAVCEPKPLTIEDDFIQNNSYSIQLLNCTKLSIFRYIAKRSLKHRLIFVTQEELGKILGVRRETINRLLKTLDDQNLILKFNKTNGCCMYLLNPLFDNPIIRDYFSEKIKEFKEAPSYEEMTLRTSLHLSCYIWAIKDRLKYLQKANPYANVTHTYYMNLIYYLINMLSTCKMIYYKFIVNNPVSLIRKVLLRERKLFDDNLLRKIPYIYQFPYKPLSNNP